MLGLSSRGALVVGATLACALSLPAHADPTITVTVNVDHGHPGDTVHATVTLTECDATSVQLSLWGASAAGDETGTTGADAAAQPTSPGVWEVDVVVSDRLAAPQDLQVIAQATCPASPGPGGTPEARASFRVDAFDTQHLDLSPDRAAAGDVVRYAMTGGQGSCWSATIGDAGGTTWYVFLDGNPPGHELASRTDPGSDMSTHVSGTFDVPSAMALGTATMTVHCSQTVDRPASLQVVAPASAPDGLSAAPSAAAGTTPASTAGTDDTGRSGSKVTLGGGVPVVTDPPDPRFPLPVLAPPLTPTPAPTTATVAVVPVSTGGSSTTVWWLLLGLLVVPVLAVPWRARHRRWSSLSGS